MVTCARLNLDAVPLMPSTGRPLERHSECHRVGKGRERTQANAKGFAGLPASQPAWFSGHKLPRRRWLSPVSNIATGADRRRETIRFAWYGQDCASGPWCRRGRSEVKA